VFEESVEESVDEAVDEAVEESADEAVEESADEEVEASNESHDRILQLFKEAKIQLSVEEIEKLPKWQHVVELYGDGVVIVGKDNCVETLMQLCGNIPTITAQTWFPTTKTVLTFNNFQTTSPSRSSEDRCIELENRGGGNAVTVGA